MGHKEHSPTAPSFWLDEDDGPERPHCRKCQMRMITIRNPKPKFECLRCGYAEAIVATD